MVSNQLPVDGGTVGRRIKLNASNAQASKLESNHRKCDKAAIT